MIKTKHGKTKLSGSVPEILADYSVITDSILDSLTNNLGMNEDEAKDKLKRSFDRGVNSVEDNSNIGISILKELMDLIKDSKADVDSEIKGRKGEE